MALQCNIDARGKVVRLIWGILLLAAGIALILIWARRGGGWPAWTAAAVCLLGGALAVFEARAGWCIVRAMGIRTPI